jgi:formylglycine-generating enzyme required for sulfatase activity
VDAPATGDSSEIDLLKQTFQPVRGDFTFHEGTLWVPPVAWATAQIAYTPPERYEVKVVATSMVEGRGDLAIGLTMSGRMFCVRLDDRPGWYKNGKYRLSGIDMAGTGTVGANESTREVDVFRPGVPCTVQVQVVPGRVRLACGDREIFDWRGDPSRLRQRPEWGVPNPSQLYIGGHQIQISQMTVRPIADIVVAEPANPKPEESVQPDAAAEPPATGSSSGKPPAPAVAPFADKAAKMYQKLWAKHLHVPSMQVNSIGMKLVLIPPGEFDMGSPKSFVQSEQHRSETPDFYRARLPGEMPNHHVRITKPFWIGASEVTQDEYQRVMGDNPSRFQGPNRPVEQVTWDLAAEFCKKLSSLPGENAAGRQYALPTEAQWEYACRAGDPGPRCFSNWTRPMPASLEEKMLADYAWFDVDAGGQTHPVGQARPNGWGLYDVHGNVWEWCSDWYGDYANSPADDPAGPRNGPGRVHRGGGWRDPAASCRSAHRANAAPANRQDDLGLRIVLVFREKLDQQVPPAKGNSR